MHKKYSDEENKGRMAALTRALGPPKVWSKYYAKPLPKVGDDIYVGSSFYLGHGVDDFRGGLCKVFKVKEGISGSKPTHYVSVKERPGHSYNWEFLAERQDKLKEEHGEARGYSDPDYDPQFNRWK